MLVIINTIIQKLGVDKMLNVFCKKSLLLPKDAFISLKYRETHNIVKYYYNFK